MLSSISLPRALSRTFAHGIVCIVLHFFLCPASGSLAPLSTDLKLSSKGVVNVLCPMPDGSLLVGGNFSSIHGVPRENLAKIRADGSVDLDWVVDVDGPVYAIGYDMDYIYVGGSFTSAGYNSVSNLFRIGRDLGSGVDYAWTPLVDGTVYAIGIDNGEFFDSLYIGGAFTSIDGSSAQAFLARFDVSFGRATLDTSWLDAAPNGTVRCILVADGGAYVGGDFSSIDGAYRSRGAHVSDYGSVGGWSPNANGRISAICKTSEGFVVGGSFTQIGGSGAAYLAVLNSGGGVAASFPTQATAPVDALLMLGNHIYAGGAATLSQTCFRFGVSSPYAADTAYKPNLDGAVLALAPSGSGIAVGGSFIKAGTAFAPGFTRLNLSNAATLNSAHKGALKEPTVSAFAALPDGGVVAGGHFDLAGEIPVTNVAKFNAAGVPDASWQPKPDSQVTSLAVSGDQLFIGGYFANVGGLTRSRLAKVILSGTGAVDANWNPGANDVPFVLHIANNALYVGGKFTRLGGLTRNRLGRLALAGTGAADSTWSMECNNSVRALESDGSYLYAGGEFSTVAGLTRQGLARGNLTNGALDSAWRLAALSSGYVSSLRLDQSWLYVGGGYSFWGAENLMVYSLCRVATGPSATRDTTWRPGISTLASINTLCVSDGYLYAGGYFSGMGAQLGQNAAPSTHFARVHTTGRGAAEPLWPGADASIYASVISGKRLYLGGTFNTVGGLDRKGNAVINLDSPAMNSAIAVYGSSTAAGALTARRGGAHTGVSHFRVGAIGNGQLFLSDATDPLFAGNFVSVAQAAAGFTFKPTPGSMLTGWFELQEATAASAAAVVGTASTSFIHMDRAEQTLSFTNPGTLYYQDGTCTLVASATSGGPVTFFRISGPISISGSVAYFTGVGEAVIEARQVGTNNHLPASSVRQTFLIRSPDYPEWARRIWGAGASPSLTDPAADTDGDGTPNLLEFAFGSNPAIADRSPRSPLSTAELTSGETRLTLRFSRRRATAAPELSYVAEFSDSPNGPWTPQSAVTTAPVDAEWETATAFDLVPLSTNRARFGRVRFSSSTP